MKEFIAKADTLIEALPYIRTFRGETFVVKIGGRAMEDPELKRSICQDLVLLKYIGVNPVVVHGGGPAISDLMKRLGKTPRFINGLRVTDDETMELVEMVLIGKINRDLAATVARCGGRPVGLSGTDGNLLVAQRMAPVRAASSTGGGEAQAVDLGRVGELRQINRGIIEILTREGYIPVISSVATSLEGQSLNVNADHVAGELASALQAAKLILITDVEGIFEDPAVRTRLISVLGVSKAEELIASGGIEGGMIPKVEACIRALEGKVPRTHIVNGQMTHSLLLEIFTDQGIGTMVVQG